MEIFPLNKKQGGHYVKLGEHYHLTLKRLGYDDRALPECLFFTFCGDILGSGEEHYEKGEFKDFENICMNSSLSFSDDYMESLAMHIMREVPVNNMDLAELLPAKEQFFDLIADHFDKLSESYSPWFGAIRNARDPQKFLDVIYEHGSCGAAMRATVMAADKLDDAQAFGLFLMTHGHVEGLEGGFFVRAFAAAAKEGQNYDEAYREGKDASLTARKLTRKFHDHMGLPRQEHAPLHSYTDRVLDKDDAYASISDIEEEGIETRFVVGAVMYVLRPVFDNSDATTAIPAIIQNGLHIGGDPDTICSIALGLYGSRWPDESRAFLDELTVGSPL